MIAGGVWVLVGLAAVALAGPWAAAAVGCVIAAVWAAGSGSGRR